ncbi:hypothetical protein V5799_024552 [Amblyomma americanum]|uniref:Uncharacterized protein n=1 Tax=Amblyomma americanum TaxID=6943 RepID=A0AAQ4EC08_AMBAM
MQASGVQSKEAKECSQTVQFLESICRSSHGTLLLTPGASSALALELAGLHCPGGSATKVASAAASRVPLGWPARLLCRGVKLKQRLVSGLLLAASALLFLTLVRITGVRQSPFAAPQQAWVPSHRKGVAGPQPAPPQSGPDPSGVLGKKLLTKASVEGGSRRTASEARGGGQADVQGSQPSSSAPPPVLKRGQPSAKGSKKNDQGGTKRLGNAAPAAGSVEGDVGDPERQRPHDMFEDLVLIAWPSTEDRRLVRPRRYNPTLGHILQIETSRNMTSWEQFQTGIAREYLYPEKSELIERILHEMATLPIVHVGEYADRDGRCGRYHL